MTDKTRTFEWAEEFPNVLKLLEIEGPKTASVMLGLSENALPRFAKENKVRLVYELASAHLLKERCIGRQVSLVVKGDNEKVQSLKPLMEAMDIEFMELDM